MVEPVTLAFVSGTVLAEGIRFLYDLAGDFIVQRRAKGAAGDGDGARAVDVTLPPETFAGQIGTVVVPDRAVAAAETTLLDGREQVSRYVDGTVAADAADPDVQRRVETLRQALESLLGRRITFVGEDREPSGVEIKIKAADVGGSVEGVAGREPRGRMKVDIDVQRVKGNVRGTHITDDGRPADPAGA
ncbi:hypothetical protein GWI34_18475 [Actinomadura sp. DSM 109109]|nr:hypothetical protein [Actinomadura lepetitiana]